MQRYEIILIWVYLFSRVIFPILQTVGFYDIADCRNKSAKEFFLSPFDKILLAFHFGESA